MKEEIDYFGHVYENGQSVEIEGNVLMLIAQFLTEVIQKETDYFAGFSYASEAHEVKDSEGNLMRVDSEWKDHTKESFLLTAANTNGAKLGLTSTGVKASQILSGILHLHKNNIKNNIAKKQEELNTDAAFKS